MTTANNIYKFTNDTQPDKCPLCGEIETQEYTIEDGEKYQAYGYQCIECGFVWEEYYRYGGFMSWKPEAVMDKWEAKTLFKEMRKASKEDLL